MLHTGKTLLEISEEDSAGLLERISFVEKVNDQLSIFEEFKRDLIELKRCKMGFIDFNMIDKNNYLTNSIAGAKEGHHVGMITELKNSVQEHKRKLNTSLNLMIEECSKEIYNIENDELFSKPENLENLDKNDEFEVINK